MMQVCTRSVKRTNLFPAHKLQSENPTRLQRNTRKRVTNTIKWGRYSSQILELPKTYLSETTPSVHKVISAIGTWHISYSQNLHDKDQRSSHETARHFLQVALQVQPRTKAK